MSNIISDHAVARLRDVVRGILDIDDAREAMRLLSDLQPVARQQSTADLSRPLTREELMHRETVPAIVALALLDERDAARAELDDYRKAWALLDEPGAELRHAHTAEEAARQFVAKIGAARAELAAARMALSPIGVTEGALPGLIEHLRAELAKMTAFADKECAARMDAQVELAKVTAERDTLKAQLLNRDLTHDITAEKALEATRAEYDGYREEARRHGDELRARCAMLASAVDRDKTGLGAALNAIISHVKSYTWLLEGRGSYEWDDDRYREEAGHAMRPVIEIAEKALGASGTLAYRTLTAPGDAGVATWLEGVKAEARLAGAQAVLPTLSDEASRALAAHDAQVEAKARAPLLALLRNVNGLLDDVDQGPRTENSTEWRIPWSRHTVEVFTDVARALAGKDGTTP